MPQLRRAQTTGGTRWVWPGQSVTDLGRLVIDEGRAHRLPVPGAHRCVVEAFDVDRDAGLAAALILTLPFRGAGTAYLEGYEYDASHGWISAGDGRFGPADRALATARPSAARSGPSALIRVGGTSGGRSLLERLRLAEAGRDRAEMTTVHWVNVSVIDVSVEVDHLLFAERRIEVPAHGRCVIVWKSAAPTLTGRLDRPRIAAVDQRGRTLTELGPGDVIDTTTQALLDELT